jgi:hypothetical protein
MITSFTVHFSIPAFRTASSMTIAPNFVAPILARVPLKFPNGVLTALTITASRIASPMIEILLLNCLSIEETGKKFKQKRWTEA